MRSTDMNTTAPRVSVICTVRNGKKHLGPVLDSVLAQSFPDWELIVVDDGSSDGTPELVSACARQDPRVRLVRTPGVGRGHALNLALREASAPFIANVDADDPMHPERLRLQVAAMEQNPGFDVIATDSLLVEGDEAPVWPQAPVAPLPVKEVTRGLATRNVVVHSCVIMRAEALRAVHGYDAQRKSQFDYDLWVRLAAHGSRIGTMAFPLAAKRKHAGQSFENKQRMRYLWRSALVQSRAIRAVGAPPSMQLAVAARLAYGLLPDIMRNRVRKQSREALTRLRGLHS